MLDKSVDLYFEICYLTIYKVKAKKLLIFKLRKKGDLIVTSDLYV